MKFFTKKQITSAIKITVLSAILIVGLNYANAAWSGPTATAPNGNTSGPINIGTTSQIKGGGLGVNALSVFGDGLFTGKISAKRFCFASGICVSSWPEACAITQSASPTITLSASPTTVVYNGQSVLTWTSTNTTSCSANWTTSTATSGTATKSNLTSTTTYTITCTGTGGSTQASATVTVGSAPPAPTISLSASPTSVSYNGNSTLTWSSTNATSCSTPMGNTTTSGSETLYNLTLSDTYSVSCTGAGGTRSADVSIYVSACTQYTYYLNSDGDYYGAGSAVGTSCASGIPVGHTTNNTDCNDNDKTLYRNFTLYADRDGDGYYSDKGQTFCVGDNLTKLINGNPPEYQAFPGGDCYDGNAQAGRQWWPYTSTFAPYFTTNRGDGSFDYNCDGGVTKRVGTVNALASETTYPYVKDEYNRKGVFECRPYEIYKMCTRGAAFSPTCGTTFSFCGPIQYGASTMYADSSCTTTVGSPATPLPGTYLDGSDSLTQGCF